MSGIVVFLVVGGIAWVCWKLLGLGDALNGWHELRGKFKRWRRHRGRRNSPYIYVGAAIVIAYLLVTRSAARSVGWFGLMTAGELAWLFASWAIKLWFVAGIVVAGCVTYQQARRRRRYMAGEPANPRGLARAALMALARDAVSDALPSLRSKGEGQSPVAGSVDFFTVTVGQRTTEYGLRFRLHMEHGMTIANVRGYTSDGMNPVEDRLATYVTASMRHLVEARTPEARRMLAYSRSVPTFPYTAVSLIRTPSGEVNPGRCDLLLLRKNPLTEVYHYPKARPKVASLDEPLLVGVTMEAAEAKARIRESHTALFGMNRSGKTFYTLNLAIGASQCPNVAFVVLDMKGPSGDLMSLKPRAASTTGDLEEATLVLEWLVGEMERRSKLAGDVGKLTKFSAELPEIIVWADEWHEWMYDLPDKSHAERRLEAMDRLLRRGATFGIYWVAATQIVHAKQVSTSTTGQFHNKVSTKLGLPSHTNMVFPNIFTGTTGPHHIPPDWKGVAYGQFGDDARVMMIRSLLSGPGVAATWAARDANAGLNVPLPDLAEMLVAHRDAARIPELVSVATGPATATVNGWTVAVGDLPGRVLEAAAACWDALGVDPPAEVTAKGLRDLSQKARTKVENRKGATADEKEAIAAHRETIRHHLNPET